MSCRSETALWCSGYLDGNAGHAMLSTQGFKVRHATGHEGIHIDTRHPMRHHDRTWGDTAHRHGWQAERCTRGVHQDIAASRHVHGSHVSRSEPGCTVRVTVVDGPMQPAIVAEPAATADQGECGPRGRLQRGSIGHETCRLRGQIRVPEAHPMPWRAWTSPQIAPWVWPWHRESPGAPEPLASWP